MSEFIAPPNNFNPKNLKPSSSLFNLSEEMAGNKNHSPYRLGLEVWQGLTVITVILTMASGLMWFASSQPQTLEQEFTWVDQNKSKVVNLQQTAHANLNNLDFKPITYSVEQECYQDFIKNYPTTTQSSVFLEEINQQELSVNKIREEYESRNKPVFGRTNNFLEYLSQAEDYLASIKLEFQTKEEFLTAEFKLKTELINICQTAIADLEKSISGLVEELNNQQQSGILPGDWLSLIEKWLGGIQELIKTEKSDEPTTEEQIKNLEKLYQSIFEYPLEPTIDLESIKTKEDDFWSALQSLEDWQAETIKTEPNFKWQNIGDLRNIKTEADQES